HVLRMAMEGEKIVIAASATSSEACISINGQGGLISPTPANGPRRVIKIPASLLLAYRLIELNRGRMQGRALDGDGAREAFVITLMKADEKASWHENDSAADVAHRRLVSARAHVSLDSLRIALVRGEGSDALEHIFQSLGTHVDVLEASAAANLDSKHDLVMVPDSAADLAAPVAATAPCLIYGREPGALDGKTGAIGSVPAEVDPLQLAAAVMVATGFDPASRSSS